MQISPTSTRKAADQKELLPGHLSASTTTRFASMSRTREYARRVSICPKGGINNMTTEQSFFLAALRRKEALAFFLTLATLALATSTITTFNAPGAGKGSGQGTFALNI